MHTGADSWRVREGTDADVIAALFLRTRLGVRAPAELPALRGVNPAAEEADREVAEQWLQFWQMTVEPESHPAGAPLELVDGYGNFVALPRPAAALRHAVAPLAAETLAYVERALATTMDVRREHDLAGTPTGLAWTTAVRAEEQRRGRTASPFLVNAQVLPLAQRGSWWIGGITVALSDALVGDPVSYTDAIRSIVADVF